MQKKAGSQALKLIWRNIRLDTKKAPTNIEAI
jgi:hypothetical protein